MLEGRGESGDGERHAIGIAPRDRLSMDRVDKTGAATLDARPKRATP